jgi:CRISPR/Cas system-associated protein Cas10 (large subunit of type III CRISPR-Cas system)
MMTSTQLSNALTAQRHLITGDNWNTMDGSEKRKRFDTVQNEIENDLCPKYKAQILPDENGNCSLCGELHVGMIETKGEKKKDDLCKFCKKLPQANGNVLCASCTEDIPF